MAPSSVIGAVTPAALVIQAPFHPMPLRRLLGGRGYRSVARAVAPDHWRVAFRREAPSL